MRLISIIVAAVLAGSPAAAGAAEPWQVGTDRLSASAAGLSFPVRAGGLALTETREASRAGDGVDAVAQYKSPDREVFATLFVFMPTYADAALTAYEVDKVIHENYGARTSLASSAVVPAGGTAQGAIRRVYLNAMDGKLVTAAAVAKTGRWIAVLRVSGPRARRAEVETGLDALLSGLTARIDPVAELRVSECPSPSRKSAKKQELRLGGALGLSNDPVTRSLIDAVLSQRVPDDKDKPPLPVSIAANGFNPVCVRERVATASGNVIDLMQPAGDTAAPAAIVGVVNDAGRTIEMSRTPAGAAYEVRVHDVASTDNYGTFDRPLAADQVRAILTGDRKAPRLLSKTEYKADGTFGTTVLVSMPR